jgi:hypothetical protein
LRRVRRTLSVCYTLSSSFSRFCEKRARDPALSRNADVCWRLAVVKTFDLLNFKDSGLDTVSGLFSKAHSQMWDPDRSVEWSAPVDDATELVDVSWVAFSKTAAFKALEPHVQQHFAKRALAHLVQSFVLAESVAQHVCLLIGLKSRWSDHRNHAAAQALDESRHHLVLSRVLDLLGGPQEEADPSTRAMFDRVLALEDLQDLVCWEQFYLESVAVNVLRDVARHATHPIIKQVFTHIQRDEARHMGFGVAFVKDLLLGMTLDEQVAFASQWLPQILTLPFNHQDPLTISRTVRWLREAGVDNSLQVCRQMMAEQGAVLERRTRQIARGTDMPQELKSARAVGLLKPEILEALNLQHHPLLQGVTAR